jgi:hypothetical protein
MHVHTVAAFTAFTAVAAEAIRPGMAPRDARILRLRAG